MTQTEQVVIDAAIVLDAAAPDCKLTNSAGVLAFKRLILAVALLEVERARAIVDDERGGGE